MDAALNAFGRRGYDVTSLDAIANELGVRKQTILYYFPSKDALLGAAVDQAALSVAAALESAVAQGRRSGRAGYATPGAAGAAGSVGAVGAAGSVGSPGAAGGAGSPGSAGSRGAAGATGAPEAAAASAWDRVEAIVRGVFRLAGRQPEILGLLREVSRLGPPGATRFALRMEPLIDRATAFLEDAMERGELRGQDARLLLFMAYSSVVGVATEMEVLRALGVEPTARSTVRQRRALLGFLRSALVPER